MGDFTNWIDSIAIMIWRDYSSGAEPGDTKTRHHLYGLLHTSTLGGKTVELIYPARNHSDDMKVVYFPVEQTVLAVDHLSLNHTAGLGPPRLDAGCEWMKKPPSRRSPRRWILTR